MSPGSGPAEDGPASRLSGLELEGGWRVVERLERPPGATGGTFSIGYIVEGPSGERAFLKALDYSSAFEADDVPKALEAMTTLFNYERDLLAKCERERLNRVVRALTEGQVRVPAADIPVNYLIFELANGDIRDFLAITETATWGWRLRMLHQVAIGLDQLHRHGMAHQDLKPSNVLIFGTIGSKLADLGRAAYRGHAAPFDGLTVAGDRGYAPPELLYGEQPSAWVQRCQACDMYLLGSLVVFLFAGVSLTSAIMSRLPAEMHWMEWSGTYVEILPYIREAFDESLDEFALGVEESLRDALVLLVRQLCDPDVEVRGHPKNRAGRGSSFSLERYIAAFDVLVRRAEIASRAA